MDGSLQTSFKNEIKYVKRLYDLAIKKGVIVCGLAKTRHLRAILLFLAAVCMYPLHDSIAKLLTADLAIMQVVWGKFIFQTAAVMAIVLPRAPRAVFRSRRLGLQLGRSLLLLLSMVLFVTAISFLPLADAVSILYVSPILVTAATSNPATTARLFRVCGFMSIPIGFCAKRRSAQIRSATAAPTQYLQS